MSVLKESDIQAAILDYLDAKQIFHWRCSLGGIRHAGIGRKKNPMKGFPDLAGVLPPGGRLFTIEVKKPGGTMSPEQVFWRDELTKRGVAYCLATSVEDVKMFLASQQPRQDFAFNYEKSDSDKRKPDRKGVA